MERGKSKCEHVEGDEDGDFSLPSYIAPPFSKCLLKQLEGREIGTLIVRYSHPRFFQRDDVDESHNSSSSHESDFYDEISFSEEEESGFSSSSYEAFEQIPQMPSASEQINFLSSDVGDSLPTNQNSNIEQFDDLQTHEVDKSEDSSIPELEDLSSSSSDIERPVVEPRDPREFSLGGDTAETPEDLGIGSVEISNEDVLPEDSLESVEDESGYPPVKKRAKFNHHSDEEEPSSGQFIPERPDKNSLESSSEIGSLLSKRSRDQMSTPDSCTSQDKDNLESQCVEHNPNRFRLIGHYSPFTFREQMSSHDYFVRRLQRYKKLQGHTGCVNTTHWSDDGHFLITGGDDTTVAIWDYELGGVCRQRIQTGHIANIFSAKFLENGSNDYFVSCARDGKVMAFPVEHGEILPHKEAVRPVAGVSLLDCTCHRGEVKRLLVDKESPMVFQSCGSDGRVYLYDIRENHRCEDRNSLLALVDCSEEISTMDGDPTAPNNFIIAGSSKYVSLYDKRRPGERVGVYGTNHRRNAMTHITGVAYNQLGTEIVASYSGNVAYMFHVQENLYSSHMGDAVVENEKTYTQAYKGHKNTDTVKSINFFGPHSEYVVSGSDCGRIFIYDKYSAEVINCFPADNHIVNCITGHPLDHTVLASSGIENHVYLWSPTATKEADLSDLAHIMEENDTETGRGSRADILRRFMLAQWLRHEVDMEDDSDEDAPEGCSIQ